MRATRVNANRNAGRQATGIQVRLPERIYHLAELSNWPFIQRDGLLCASRLVSAAGFAGTGADRLNRTQRQVHTVLPNSVRVRDQRPMLPAALENCLCDMSPADWYAMVNARVFFWLDPERLNRQKAACEPRPQIAIAVDTAASPAAHQDRVALTPINTGNARRKPARRGSATFVPFALWVESGWASEANTLGTSARKQSHQPVELTVLDAVPGIMEFVVGVFPLTPDQAFDPGAV